MAWTRFLGSLRDGMIFVHMRLLVLAVENSNARPLVRNLIKMLQSGRVLCNRVSWNFRELRVIAVDEVMQTLA